MPTLHSGVDRRAGEVSLGVEEFVPARTKEWGQECPRLAQGEKTPYNEPGRAGGGGGTPTHLDPLQNWTERHRGAMLVILAKIPGGTWR